MLRKLPLSGVQDFAKLRNDYAVEFAFANILNMLGFNSEIEVVFGERNVVEAG
jgi:hypothetical protein